MAYNEGDPPPAETQSTDKAWWEKLLSGIGGLAGGIGNTVSSATGLNPLSMLMYGVLAKYIDQQQNKSGMGTSEALGYANNAAQFYTDRAKEASVPQDTKDTLLSSLTNRATTPSITPITGANMPTLQNAPKVFNPYASGQMGSGVDTQGLAMLENIAKNGASNPMTSSLTNLLGTQIGQRFGSRDMRTGNQSGALNTVPIAGTTSPYTNLRPQQPVDGMTQYLASQGVTGMQNNWSPMLKNLYQQYQLTRNPNTLQQFMASYKGATGGI